MSGDPASSRKPSLFPREPRRVGKFEFLMRLGQGGMATVYLARTVSTGGFQRLAAIKLMHQFLGSDEQFVEMFLDEARVAANIRHPNVVSIVDLGAENDHLFMVMDYVEGDTLAAVEGTAARLARAIPLGVVLRVVLDALQGLDAAHELHTPDGEALKVVHRDVSPQNILVGVDGTARLTDFGIARAEQRIASTRTGMLKGKVPFMAPEQFEGKPVDRRADVFAMGVTLWEAIALRRLFPNRENYDQAVRNARAPYRPLREVLPSVPQSLDAVVQRSLANDPDDRFPTAAAFADALEHEFRSVIATHRQVGAFMSAVAAEKIQRERDAVRNAPKPEPDDGRTAIRATGMGARKNDEPVSPVVVRAFESRPPPARPATPAPAPANDTAALDDDPEVDAALRALAEMPGATTGVEEIGAQDLVELPAPIAELPVPLAELPAPLAALPAPLPRDHDMPRLAGRLRATVDNGSLPSRRAAPVVPPPPAAPPPSVRPRPSLRVAAPRREGPPESHEVPTVPRRRVSATEADRIMAAAQQQQESPRKSTRPRPLAESLEEPTQEFDLVRGKPRAPAQAQAERVKALIEDKPLSFKPPSMPSPSAKDAAPPRDEPTKSMRPKAATERRIAQFPALAPAPKDRGLIANRWVSRAVLAAVLLVVCFVLVRSF